MKKINIGLFAGRFQPLHEGHIKCIKHILKKHKKCVVLIRNTEKDEQNPFSSYEVLKMFDETFPKENVEAMIIPDFDTIYIGRDVGYGLIKLDEKTEKISATNIRKKLYDK